MKLFTLIVLVVINLLSCELELNPKIVLAKPIVIQPQILQISQHDNLDEFCQNEGDGTILDWAICTRRKVDSLANIMETIYLNEIDELNSEISAYEVQINTVVDPDEKTFLNEQLAYYLDLKFHLEKSQKAFNYYLIAECQFIGAFTGTGRARTGNENVREIELLINRMRFFEKMDFN